MKEGRVFALTGPEMLELAEICEYNALGLEAETYPGSDYLYERSWWWWQYLRREHAAHFAEAVKIETAAFRCPSCRVAWIIEKTENFSEDDWVKCKCGATAQIIELTRGARPASWELLEKGGAE